MNLILCNVIIIYLISLIPSVSNRQVNLIYDKIYYTISNKLIVYCSRYEKNSKVSGCYSDPEGNIGTLVYLRNGTEIDAFIYNRLIEDKDNYIGVISYNVYRNKFLLKKLINKKKFIKGLVLLEPDQEAVKNDVCDSFVTCKSANDYVNVRWPFPLILIKRTGDAQAEIDRCVLFSNLKVKCAMEINLPQFQNVQAKDCSKKKFNMFEKVSKTKSRCQFVNGYNYFYVMYNPIDIENYTRDFIILYTHTNVFSMFDGAGYSSNGIIPVVAVLLNVINVLQKYENVFKYDLVVGFLENYMDDYVGIELLYRDLKNLESLFHKRKFKIENIKFALHLKSLTQFNNADYYITQSSSKEENEDFYKYLHKIARLFDMNIYEYNYHETKSNITNEKLKIRIVRDYSQIPDKLSSQESFNDKYPYPSRKYDIARYSLFLITALTNFVVSNNTQLDEMYMRYIYLCFLENIYCHKQPWKLNVKKEEILFGLEIFDCFTKNNSCPLLLPITRYLEKHFLDVYTNPFVCQDQKPKSVMGILTTSQFNIMLKRVILFKFGKIAASSKECERKTNFYFLLNTNNNTECVFAKVVAREEPFDYEWKDKDGNVRHYYKYTVNLIKKPTVRLFRIPDSTAESILLVTGTIFIALTFFSTIFLQEWYSEHKLEMTRKKMKKKHI